MVYRSVLCDLAHYATVLGRVNNWSLTQIIPTASFIMDCKKRRYYTNELKKEIIQKVKDGISRSDIQKEYGISKSSLSRWITLMRERRYRSVNTVKKYTDTIEAKKYIINRKLATITKDLAALKARATADLMTMMMAMTTIKKAKKINKNFENCRR